MYKRIFFILFIFFIFNSCQTKIKTQKQQPNIILIYADDLGLGDVGIYGGEVATPNIDRLADYGVTHRNAYATASTCTPSRYSLLTGEYAWREKNRGVVNGDAAALIPKGKQTVASLFKKAGYQTAVIGKWHLGLGDENGIDWNKNIINSPSDIGFDYHFIMPSTSDRVPTVYVENSKVVNLEENDPIEVSYQKNFENIPTGKENPELLKLNYSHGHDMSINNGISRIGFQKGGKKALWNDENIADDFIEKSKEFIVKNKNNPFFLYLATNNIHVPRMPHPRFQGKTKQGLRGDAILELDDMVGSITKVLDSLKLSENTIVIFSSDNGPVLDDGYDDHAIEKNGNHQPTAGFRGGKYSLYQGGTRIPFIVSWKGKIKKMISETPISQVDFLGVVSQITGVNFDAKQAFDTQLQWKNWIGKSTKKRDFIIQEGLQNQLTLIKENYKYIPPTSLPRKVAWETGIETGFNKNSQLFNIKTDPYERKNIASEKPKKVEFLHFFLENIKTRKK